jgi:hypothetical protein
MTHFNGLQENSIYAGMNETKSSDYHIICDLLFTGPLDEIVTSTKNISTGLLGSVNSSQNSNIHYDVGSNISHADSSFSGNENTFQHFRPLRILTIIICGIGIIGNIFNVIIFLKRAPYIKANSLEKSANVGFLALSVCDMFFCGLAMMKHILPPNQMVYETVNVSLFFELYLRPFLDILFKISGWLTVTLAVTRYLAVCHPIKTRQYFNAKQTYIAIFLCPIIWVLLMMPLFFTFRVERITCYEQELIALDFGAFATNIPLRNGFQLMWTILGFFVPAVILMFCNTSLMVAFRQSARVRASNSHWLSQQGKLSHKNRKITLTLIVVVVMYILLVTPSQILQFVIDLSDNDFWSPSFRDVVEICNVMLVANSCLNFFAYMLINVYFRETLISCFIPSRGSAAKLGRFHGEHQSLAGSFRGITARESTLSSINSGRVTFNVVQKTVTIDTAI